ncbi:uncharacterized protein VTP21DRAFT_3071 [Calcarisporiella thermophila]|uniref:uncharacterized protein n=1 Tax=Calcarisporiella thermophila TaxID=911321 RepID=UPI0037434A5D
MKAQQSVLKQAVIKEQNHSVSLQHEIKGKEQELRRLLEQIDLLTLHNQRLTKRIENLQVDATPKSSGFSFGASAIKKELERSKAALEAATLDLRKKIEENEKLHREVYEVNSLYTQHINLLQEKVTMLERKLNEAEEASQKLLSSNEIALADSQRKVENLEGELARAKEDYLKAVTSIQQDNARMEIHDKQLQDELNMLKEALTILFKSVENSEILQKYLDSPIGELTSDSSVAVKSAIESWLAQYQDMRASLLSLQERIRTMTQEKEDLLRQHQELTARISALTQNTVETKDQFTETEEYSSKQVIDTSHGEDILKSAGALSELPVSLSQDTTSDKILVETQVTPSDVKTTEANEEPTLEIEEKTVDDNASTHVQEQNGYIPPVDIPDNKQPEGDNAGNAQNTKDLEPSDIPNTASESNDVARSASTTLESSSSQTDDTLNEFNLISHSEKVRVREELIKKHYEAKVQQLMEMLQIADSKSARLYKAYDSARSKLASIAKENASLKHDNARLQDELTTTVSNYQQQLDALTDHMASLSRERELRNETALS